MAEKSSERCPHCNGALVRWLNPEDSSWGLGYQMVCFNDHCPYYERGWKWMKEHYNVTASYRYRFNPENGESGPLPVCSPRAGRGNIIDESSKKEDRT